MYLYFFQNYNIEAKVEQLHEINDKNSMDSGHTAEEINENKTMDTDHKAKNDIAVAAQRQLEKITRYTRDPTILQKVTRCHTIQTRMFLPKRNN